MEYSLSKNHPIQDLEWVKSIYRGQGIKIRIRYRGPRRDPFRQTTLKRDAVSFAVYPA